MPLASPAYESRLKSPYQIEIFNLKLKNKLDLNLRLSKMSFIQIEDHLMNWVRLLFALQTSQREWSHELATTMAVGQVVWRNLCHFKWLASPAKYFRMNRLSTKNLVTKDTLFNWGLLFLVKQQFATELKAVRNSGEQLKTLGSGFTRHSGDVQLPIDNGPLFACLSHK